MKERIINVSVGEKLIITVNEEFEYYSIAQVMKMRGGTRKTVTNRLKKHNLLTYSGTRPKVSQEQLNKYLTIYK